MINKRKQELIKQNLQSISTEVRIKAIEQLVNLPMMPADQKIEALQTVKNDPEETVKTYANQCIDYLYNVLQAEKAASPAVNTPLNQSHPENLQPVTEETVGDSMLKNQNGDISSAFSEPDISLTNDSSGFQLPDENSFGGVSLPAIDGLNNSVSNEQFNGNESSPVIEPAVPAKLEEEMDPSLPDLKTLISIPDRLNHISNLAKSKLSGHVTQLLALASDVQEEVSLTALQTLLNLKDSRVPQQILKKLSEEGFSSQRRFLMLKIIMESEVPLDFTVIEGILMNEKDVIVKSGLVKVYARSSGDAGVNTLIHCLNDEDPRVRANTVEVIEEQKIQGCDEHIFKLLQDEENRVKVNAAKFLVKNGYKEAFVTLRSMLVSPEVWLRDSVIFALGEIGDQASLTLLKAALKDPNQGIRLSVLKALAKINNSHARQVLRAATNDPDAVVAQVASSLCEKIKDTPLREIPQPEAKTFGSISQSSQPQVDSRAAPADVLSKAAPLKDAVPLTSAKPITGSEPIPPAQSLPPMEKIGTGAPVSKADEIPQASPLSNTPPNSNFEHPQQSMPVQSASPLSGAKPLKAAEHINPAATIPAAKETVPANVIPTAKPVSSAQPVSTAAPIQSTNLVKPAEPLSATDSVLPTIDNSVDASSINFSKPRSAEIYQKLCSTNPADWEKAVKDLPFILGDDQMILLEKAIQSTSDAVRLAAVKILSRKRNPGVRELLEKVKDDSCQPISSLVQKALLLHK